MNNGWNQWVLNYTQSRSWTCCATWASVAQLGGPEPLLIGIVVVVALAGAAWSWWDRSSTTPGCACWARARKRLRAAGVEGAAGGPPRQIAQAVTTPFRRGCARIGGLAAEGWKRSAMRAARPTEPAHLAARIPTACLARPPMLPPPFSLPPPRWRSPWPAPAMAAAPKATQEAADAPPPAAQGTPYAGREDAMQFADDIAERRGSTATGCARSSARRRCCRWWRG
jgi:hypothetical protein